MSDSKSRMCPRRRLLVAVSAVAVASTAEFAALQTVAQQRFPTRAQAQAVIEKHPSFASVSTLQLAEGDTVNGGLREGLWIRLDHAGALGLTSSGRRDFAQVLPNGTVTLTQPARRQLVNVTGITGGDLAAVEFRWQWVGLSEIVSRYTGQLSQTPRVGNAVLRLYDDGWRLQGVELDRTARQFAGVPPGVLQREREAKETLLRESTKTLGTWTFQYQAGNTVLFGGPIKRVSELRVTDIGVSVTARDDDGETITTVTWDQVASAMCPGAMQPYVGVRLKNGGLVPLAMIQTTDHATRAQLACTSIRGALDPSFAAATETEERRRAARVERDRAAKTPTTKLAVYNFQVSNLRPQRVLEISDVDVAWFMPATGDRQATSRQSMGYWDIDEIKLDRWPGRKRSDIVLKFAQGRASHTFWGTDGEILAIQGQDDVEAGIQKVYEQLVGALRAWQTKYPDLVRNPASLAGASAGGAAVEPRPSSPSGTPVSLASVSAAITQIVTVETERGTFEFETYPTEAPRTVARILELVRQGFYDGQRVHRVVNGFVVQMGDPASRDLSKKSSWGSGGSGAPIGAAEFSKQRTHVRGAVAMAHAGDASKADSQFYVTLSPAPRLDGTYTVFGHVTAGMAVVTALQVGDRIIRAAVNKDRPVTNDPVGQQNPADLVGSTANTLRDKPLGLYLGEFTFEVPLENGRARTHNIKLAQNGIEYRKSDPSGISARTIRFDEVLAPVACEQRDVLTVRVRGGDLVVTAVNGDAIHPDLREGLRGICRNIAELYENWRRAAKPQLE